MHHDRVLKTLIFYLLIPGGETQAFDRKSRLICFIFTVPLSACEVNVKILKTYRVIAVMLIYRYWVIMAYCEKLSYIKVLEKFEVHSTKRPISNS